MKKSLKQREPVISLCLFYFLQTIGDEAEGEFTAIMSMKNLESVLKLLTPIHGDNLSTSSIKWQTTEHNEEEEEEEGEE